MAPTSRRTLLSGLAALPVIAAPAVSSAAIVNLDTEVDRLWREWLRLRIEANNGSPDQSDEEGEAADNLLYATETAIEDAPPSLMQAAAVLAIGLYRCSSHNGEVPALTRRNNAVGPWPMLHALRSLRPYLSGSIAAAVARLCDETRLGAEELFDALAHETA